MFPARSTGPDDAPLVARWGSDHPAGRLGGVRQGTGTPGTGRDRHLGALGAPESAARAVGWVHDVPLETTTRTRRPPGWALAHPLAAVRVGAGLVLVPASRDVAEREIVVAVVAAARRYAAAG